MWELAFASRLPLEPCECELRHVRRFVPDTKLLRDSWLHHLCLASCFGLHALVASRAAAATATAAAFLFPAFLPLLHACLLACLKLLDETGSQPASQPHVLEPTWLWLAHQPAWLYTCVYQLQLASIV